MSCGIINSEKLISAAVKSGEWLIANPDFVGFKNPDGSLVFPNTNGSYTFLELVIEHGIGNEQLNGSYAYAYMPESSAVEVADYAKTPEIKIVKQTDTVHAVAKESLDMLGIVFADIEICKLHSLRKS